MISLSDMHIALDDVNMRKKSWITRNKFASDDDMYSLKVKDISQNRYIHEHYLIDPLSQIKEFKEYFYQINRKDAFIELIMDMLNLDLLLNHEKLNIADFNVGCLRLILSILNIKTGIILSSSLSKKRQNSCFIRYYFMSFIQMYSLYSNHNPHFPTLHQVPLFW